MDRLVTLGMPDDDFPRLGWARSQRTGKDDRKLTLLVIASRVVAESLAYYADLKRLSTDTEIPPKRLKAILNRLADDGFLASLPMGSAKTGVQTDTLYVLNPYGWLDACESAAQVLRRVSERMDIIHGREGNSPLPRWAVLLDTSSGLRLPGARSH